MTWKKIFLGLLKNLKNSYHLAVILKVLDKKKVGHIFYIFTINFHIRNTIIDYATFYQSIAGLRCVHYQLIKFNFITTKLSVEFVGVLMD